MAEVYLARAGGVAGFEKLVVLKTILPELVSEAKFVQMFVNEARLAAMLSHPNCVQIFDLGEEGDTLYIAMEYVEGFALSRVLARAKKRGLEVPEAVLARIIMDAASGLDYAHRLKSREGVHLGIVHRDVSPDNLLISFSGQVKVVDFGIAKAAATSLPAVRTNAGTVKGKHGYIAPEYLLGQPIDGRADVFALGVVLYRALTGMRPFQGENETAISFAVLEKDPTPPTELFPSLNPALASVAMMALKKDPAARFESARAMRQAVEAAVVRPAENEEVGDFMQLLWPEGDPERMSLHALASGTPEDRSNPALSAISDTYPVVTATPHRPPLGAGAAPASGSLPIVMGEAISSNPGLQSPLVPVAPEPAAFEPPATGGFSAATTELPRPTFDDVPQVFDEPPARRGWLVWVALLVVVGLGAAGLFFQKRQAPRPLVAEGKAHVSVVVPLEVEVYVDEALAGRSPAELDLKPGGHDVRFVNKAKGIDVAQRLELDAGQLVVISELPKPKKK